MTTTTRDERFGPVYKRWSDRFATVVTSGLLIAVGAIFPYVLQIEKRLTTIEGRTEISINDHDKITAVLTELNAVREHIKNHDCNVSYFVNDTRKR